MDVAVAPTLRGTRAARDERLTAVSIALLGWLACGGLLAVFAPGAAGIPSELAHLAVPLLAGILWQVAVASLSPLARLGYAAALWLGWGLLGLAGALAEEVGFRPPWRETDSLAQQSALTLGIVLGWLGGAVLARPLQSLLAPLETLSRAAVAALSVALLLLPLSPQTPLLEPTTGWHIASFEAYLRALPNQPYVALKSLILWVPLGMLFALAQKTRELERWSVAAALAFLAAGLPFLHGVLKAADLVELLSAYWGLRIGAWLGALLHRSSLAMEAGASRRAGAAVVPSAAAGWTRKIAAAALLLGVGWWAWHYPRWGYPLAAGLLLYVFLLWRYPQSWMLAVPAALPLLNLAPGTGRIYFDEFDLMLLATVAMALWHGVRPPPRTALPRGLRLALGLFGVSVLISLGIGLLPFPPVDVNAFASYWSGYNGLRIAKGFLWALLLMGLARCTLAEDLGWVMRLFVPGMWLGLAGVVAAGLWERWRFAGLAALDVPYRITATFSSMHTGGSDIETYLVMAIPFVWLAFLRERPLALRVGAALLAVLAAYLMTLTISRAGILALAVALAVLAVGAWRARRLALGTWSTLLGTTALLGGAAALAFGLSGSYLQKRLAQSEQDWAVRVSHWQLALGIRDPGWAASLLGTGLGRFPQTYLFRSGAPSLPATYRFVDEDGERFLRLGSGETSYLAQRIAVRAGERYTLSLRVRTGDAGARLHVPLCERHLLDSFRCEWRSVWPPADGRWHTVSAAIDAGSVGSGNWLTRRPVELTLYNETVRTRVDVDDIELRDRAGAQLVRNGDFFAGADYWFFKTHSHLPWHIKNLWVELLFEQGWLGVVSLTLLLAVTLGPLCRAMWRGNLCAAALLAALGGFLVVGMFGSLFDTPRLALLFYGLLLLAGVVASDFFTVAWPCPPRKRATNA